MKANKSQRIIWITVALTFFGLAGLAFAQEPVFIGVTGPMTGGSAILGEYMMQGINIAKDEVPTIWGRPVKLIVEDDVSDPGKGIATVTKLLSKDKVSVILGPMHSGVSLAIMPTVDKYNATWFSCSLSPKLTTKGSKSFFRGRSSDENYTKAIAIFAKDTLKTKKIAVLNSSDEYGSSGADAFVKNLELLGEKPIMREVFHEGDRDFTAQLSKIKAANVDAIYLHGLEISFGLIAKQARGMGIKQPFIGTSAFGTPKYIEISEGACENTYFANTFLPSEQTKVTQDFVKKWQGKYKDNPNVPNAHTAAGYDIYKMAAQAMEEAGPNASPEKIQEATRKMTYIGLQGKYNFDDKGEGAKTMAIGVIKNNEMQFIKRVEF